MQLQPTVGRGSSRFSEFVVPGYNMRIDSSEFLLRIGLQNLGALRFYRENNESRLVPIPDNGLEVSDDEHTEIVLLKMLPKPEDGCPVVSEVYSERWPCTSCVKKLNEHAKKCNSGKPINIYFITPTGMKENNRKIRRDELADTESAYLLRAAYTALGLSYPRPST